MYLRCTVSKLLVLPRDLHVVSVLHTHHPFGAYPQGRFDQYRRSSGQRLPLGKNIVENGVGNTHLLRHVAALKSAAPYFFSQQVARVRWAKSIL
jgi:hypothetical protein